MRWDQKIGRRLKLRDLHTLLAVAERKSMGKAARDLALTQPAVTKAIAEMERTLGVRVLDRTSRGVEPTPYGRVLLKWCGVIFDDLHQAVQEIDFLADPATGELRIGANEGILLGLLPAVLDRLSRQYPRVALHVTSSRSTADQYREMRNRNIDLIIGRVVKPAGGDDLNTEILLRDSFHVVAGARNRWTRRRSIGLAELANESWLLPQPDSVVWPAVEEAFRASGLDVPRASVSSSSVPLHAAMLSSGRYLGMLSSSTMSFGGARLGLKVLPVELPIRIPPIGIVSLKNRTINPLARLFIECAHSVAKPLADRS